MMCPNVECLLSVTSVTLELEKIYLSRYGDILYIFGGKGHQPTSLKLRWLSKSKPPCALVPWWHWRI